MLLYRAYTFVAASSSWKVQQDSIAASSNAAVSSACLSARLSVLRHGSEPPDL